MSCIYYEPKDYMLLSRAMENLYIKSPLGLTRYKESVREAMEENLFADFWGVWSYGLYVWNCKAYSERYNEDFDVNIREEQYCIEREKYKEEREVLQLINNLRCAQYQCSDAVDYKKSDIHKITASFLSALRKDYLDMEINNKKVKWSV